MMVKATGRPTRSDEDVEAFRSKVGMHALTLYREEGFHAVSIRRLAKEVGCAPMTIYAHFDGKTDILRHLWADVLNEMATVVRKNAEPIAQPIERLHSAALSFVSYWTDHPDHFRLVFMSNDVGRADVNTFIIEPGTLDHFKMFADFVCEVMPEDGDVKSNTDTLISAMLGIALCHNTIRGYPWTSVPVMIEQLVDQYR